MDASTMNGLMNDLNSSISEFAHEILRWAFKVKPQGYKPLQHEQYKRILKLFGNDDLHIYLNEMEALQQTATDVIDPLVRYIICDEVHRQIFLPFAPFLGPTESDSLHEQYRSKLRRESPDVCARWRAQEYQSRAPLAEDERLTRVSNRCIQQLSDLANILVGKKLSKNRFNDALFGVFKAAVRLQSIARTRYFYIDYSVTFPLSQEAFDVASMIANNPSSTRPATTVWLPIGLCLAGKTSKTPVSSGKMEQYDIAVKAEVVANNWDPTA
ncbi:hypothetical protein CPB86DRAFT_315500 [Serendipita vermifera]|nr:hypothetical protein CPB86DRAFT_315500 [Serendipita vermifera]